MSIAVHWSFDRPVQRNRGGDNLPAYRGTRRGRRNRPRAQEGEGKRSDPGPRRAGSGPRGGPAQLPARLRGGLVAVRHPAGICSVAQGADRPQTPPAAPLPAGLGDPRDYRLSPAAHARGDGTGAGGERGRRDANASGARIGRAARARRGSGPANDLWDHRPVPRILWPAQPGRFACRRRTAPDRGPETGVAGHGRARPGDRAAGATGPADRQSPSPKASLRKPKSRPARAEPQPEGEAG